MTFEDYWATEGIRLLLMNGKLPTIMDRCRHAFEAGRLDQSMEFNLPEGTHLAAFEINESEEERE